MSQLGPFPVSSVIERLQLRAPVLKLVSDAADLSAALEQEPRVDVAAYVTLHEQGKLIKYMGSVAQQNCDVTLRIVLFVRSYALQETGSGARQIMDNEVIPEVRGALFGWTPSDAFNALSFAAGRDERFRAGWLVTQQIFLTDYRMSQQVQP